MFIAFNDLIRLLLRKRISLDFVGCIGYPTQANKATIVSLLFHYFNIIFP